MHKINPSPLDIKLIVSYRLTRWEVGAVQEFVQFW